MIPVLSMKILRSGTIKYSLFTYCAIGINVLSGVALARSFGVEQRGLLAYYTNFLLLTSFVSNFNISNASARVLTENSNVRKEMVGRGVWQILFVGFLISSITAVVTCKYLISNWTINSTLFAILMILNGFGSLYSFYDGFWRYSNSINYLTSTRFLGLAFPSIFTLLLVMLGILKIEYVLFSQSFVIFLNLLTIVIYRKKHKHILFADSQLVLKSAALGYPTYIAEYLVSWIVSFLIHKFDGNQVLGWYTIALSYALLADVSFGAIEARNYQRLAQRVNDLPPRLMELIRNTFPILLMHLIFIPLAFFIPLIYGNKYRESALFSIAILLIRIPIVISRSINSFLISKSRNLATFLIFCSFLTTMIIFMFFLHMSILSVRWISAYGIASCVMLISSIVSFVIYLQREEKGFLKI